MRGSYHAALPQSYVTVFGQVFQPLSLLVMLFAIVFFAKNIATPDFVAFNAAFGQWPAQGRMRENRQSRPNRRVYATIWLTGYRTAALRR